MKVWEFEEKVRAVEGITIVIRALPDATVADYKWKRAADSGWRINELLENRINECIKPYGCLVLDGTGQQPHGGTKLPTVRDSYKPKK
ncbi:MAG: hypothetical protein IT473_05220 [Lysobacter sp.]|nr:hypothetical protein [Lysobacter sp.]